MRWTTPIPATPKVLLRVFIDARGGSIKKIELLEKISSQSRARGEWVRAIRWRGFFGAAGVLSHAFDLDAASSPGLKTLRCQLVS